MFYPKNGLKSVVFQAGFQAPPEVLPEVRCRNCVIPSRAAARGVGRAIIRRDLSCHARQAKYPSQFNVMLRFAAPVKPIFY